MGAGRVYTRKGDAGDTALVGGQRVPKDDLRLEAYGTVDELNAVIGWCRAELEAARATGALGAAGPAGPGRPGTGPAGPALDHLDAELARVQHALFDAGSALATLPPDRTAAMPRVGDGDVAALEAAMDRVSDHLAPLRNFILPGGSRLNASLHVARTVCRRAERAVTRLERAAGGHGAELRYLNRLSDALFVWARGAAHALGHEEVKWTPHPSSQ